MNLAMSKRIINDLSKLSEIKKDFRRSEMNKEEYQEFWVENKSNFRKMISKKNLTWLYSNKDSDFEILEDKNKVVYEKINQYFSKKSKRKWIIHIICNFFPLKKSKIAPRLPNQETKCPFSGLFLTDLESIKTGKNNARDKHLGFTGHKTDVILSGVALNELYNFVITHVKDYDSPFGQIINHALDNVRNSKK